VITFLNKGGLTRKVAIKIKFSFSYCWACYLAWVLRSKRRPW